MRILILGASGRTGIHAVEYALSKGHSVTALVRSPEKITLKSERLTVLKGSPEHIDDVRKAIEGCDAVVSMLNNSRASDLPWAKLLNPPTFLYDCLRNVIKVMKELKIRRISIVTAAGVGDSFSLVPFYLRWLIMGTNLRVAYEDHNNQEELLTHSNLDWTILRPVGLTNTDNLDTVSVEYIRKPFSFISRKAVAHFLIDTLSSDDFLKKMPILSQK